MSNEQRLWVADRKVRYVDSSLRAKPNKLVIVFGPMILVTSDIASPMNVLQKMPASLSLELEH